jgi:RNA polymerase sigma-70 factor, ECF subfamily
MPLAFCGTRAMALRSQTDATSPSLLDRAREHQPEAWRRLVTIYGPLTYDWARKAGLQPSDAADVVQDVFARVSTHLATFRREKAGDSFRGWLWTICANRIRDYYRDLKSRPSAEGGSTAYVRLQQFPDAPPREDSEEGSQELRRLKQRALVMLRETFEPHVWQAFWRVAVEEQSPGAVAKDLGVSVWAVYKAKARVLQRLRQELEGLMEELRAPV